ncbi:hypothetical protein [Niallia endozanthoxylica]|uniref:Uncharacterized protein n=1 Tax=Niallia endozanthoxylica TaxID=2036016 RepID=A0A5J5HSK5_9BACI|nr:hypothetical protein [Niallia endozanthoxylica]KAA9023841.1 hypothetical protein F4V44_11920 [Niallia endozanthoxylica]
MDNYYNKQQLLSEFRCMIQFIEITFKGARLEQTTIKIPRELLQGTQNKGLGDKLKATYPLFHEDFSKYTKPVKEEVDKCRSKFTRVLSKKYGRVMLVKEKAEFEKVVQAIRDKIEQYKEEVSHILNLQIEKTKQELIEYFTPILMEQPPDQLLQLNNERIEEEDVKTYIEWLLGKEFPTAEQILKRVEFYHVFKDVTLQNLQDEQFYQDIEKAFKRDQMYWPHQKQIQAELYLA